MTDTHLRPSLPLVGAHAGRSRRTCALKCGDACFHEPPNDSDNGYFADVVQQVVSRRSLLKGGGSMLVLGATAGATTLPAAPAAAEEVATAATAHPEGGNSGTGLRFTPIEPTPFYVDDLIVPKGYDSIVTIRWGDPVLRGAPEFDVERQSAKAQAGQFGYNADYVAYFPLRGSRRGLLWVNHEYTIPDIMFVPGTYSADDPTREQVDIELQAHGGTIVMVRRTGSRGAGYQYRPRSRYNRRITATTPMEITGAAAGHEWLQTSADPTGTRVLGMLNNCAGGMTPWGTVLTGEENFHQYFANNDLVTDPEVQAIHARYGLTEGESERKWERFYDRFDLAKEPHEPFRFGYIVEIDPYDPDFVPRKRTALGRCKHEGAGPALTDDGRVAAYMGDDETFEYVYKFISRRRYRRNDRKHNLRLLEDGDLYAARFDGDSPPTELERYNDWRDPGQMPSDGKFDGRGVWLPLVEGGESKVAGFTVAQVLINTRAAADAAGATKMDRPEDVERNPVNGRVYMAMTNNVDRGVGDNPGVDEANPRRIDKNGVIAGNKYGHVVELKDDGNDAGSTTFRWQLFLVCGDPSDPTTYFAGVDREDVSPIAAPDNVAFDNRGNLWIATDGQQFTIGRADAFHAVPVRGDERGRVRQFLSVPAGAEACGPEFSPDNETLFVAVQHPGDPGVAPSVWPDGQYPPRPSVASIFKTSGNPRIGT